MSVSMDGDGVEVRMSQIVEAVVELRDGAEF